MEGVAKNFEKDLRHVGEEKDENESKEDENVEKSKEDENVEKSKEDGNVEKSKEDENVEKSKEDENVEKEEKNAGEESEDWIAGYCKWFNFNKGWGFLNISGQFILEYSLIIYQKFHNKFCERKAKIFVCFQILLKMQERRRKKKTMNYVKGKKMKQNLSEKN